MTQTILKMLAIATIAAVLLGPIPVSARDNLALTFVTPIAQVDIDFDPAIGWYSPDEDFQGVSDSCGPARGGPGIDPIWAYDETLRNFQNVYLQDTENSGFVSISDEGVAAVVTDNCGAGLKEFVTGCHPVNGCFTNPENFIGLSDETTTIAARFELRARIGEDFPGDSTVISTVSSWKVTTCTYDGTTFDHGGAKFIPVTPPGAIDFSTGAVAITECGNRGPVVDYTSTAARPFVADHVPFGNGQDDSRYVVSCLDLGSITEFLAGGGMNVYTEGIDSHDWFNAVDLDHPAGIDGNIIDGTNGDDDTPFGGVYDTSGDDNGVEPCA